MRGIPSEKWRETGARLNEELAGGFNLSHGPLAQAAFLDRGKDETGVLFLSVHSLIADGISMTRLAFDIEQAYQNPEEFAAEKQDPSFVDWATSIEAFARSDSVLSELSYWQAVCRFNPRSGNCATLLNAHHRRRPAGCQPKQAVFRAVSHFTRPAQFLFGSYGSCLEGGFRRGGLFPTVGKSWPVSSGPSDSRANCGTIHLSLPVPNHSARRSIDNRGR